MVEEEAQYQITDLVIKLKILGEGLLNERKKSQEYLNKIKEYDKVLITKDDEIANLLKDKFDIQSKLDIERSRQIPQESNFKYVVNSLLKYKPSDQDEIKELNQQINQLQYELRQTKQKVVDEHESYDQNKAKFQTLITIQGEKLKELEQLKIKLSNENEDLKRENDEMSILVKGNQKEKDTLALKTTKLKEQNTSLKERVSELILTLENKTKEIYSKEDEINRLKSQLSMLAAKMTQLKNAVIDENLTTKTFKMQKIGQFFNNTEITILFNRNKINGTYEVIFSDEGKDDRINLLDVDYFKKNENYSNRIDICYMIGGSQKKISVEVDANMMDRFMQTYKDFFQKANDIT